MLADPYPWPYDGPVDPRRLALVIAGAQHAWKGRCVGADDVARMLVTVAEAVRRTGGLVVHVRHGSPGASATGGRPEVLPVVGEAGWSLATMAAPLDLVVDATGIDGFFGSPLDGALRARRIDTLVFAGYGAEGPVSSTLRSANDRSYECLTLTDASAPFGVETGRRSLSSITMSGGIFGAVATSDALLAALLPVPVPEPELSIVEAM